MNAVLLRHPYPLPKISDLLQKLQGFTYATAIDLSMGYYHIPLDEESQKLCTTILPWGKYQYKKLPMGIASAPDIFQSIMDDLLGDLEFARVYIDDILIVSDGTFEDHMDKLNQVLGRLEMAGFRANVRKCCFAEDELEYLGYLLTRHGIAPQPKKVEAILRINPPKNVRQLRHFLGMVNYYRDMWRRRSHLLAPLSSLVSKKTKWKWTEECQRSFEEMKRVMSKETLLAFPDFEDTFHIYTDASDYQLGAVIMQKGKPLAFYSRKLNAAQKRYTTGEQELLSIVEEFRNILLGQKLVVHTDHKNIIYGNLTNDRIARWRLLLEEFGPEYVHVAGGDNVVADALSRLDMQERTPETDEKASEVASEAKGDVKNANHIISYCLAQLERDDGRDDIRSEPESLAECFAAGEDTQIEEYPLSPRLIAKEQEKDTEIQESMKKSPEAFTKVTIENTEVTAVNNRMVIPKSLQGRIVAWTHHYLVHPGGTRLEKTLSKLCTWPNMARDIQAYTKTCRKCQLCKTNTKKYGQMPTKEAEPPIPWNRVNVDLIGPYDVKLKGTRNKKIQLRAMTMIDPATGWFEVKEIDAPTAECCQKAMDDAWFNRYPRPEYIGFDNGREFKSVFGQMTKNYGLKTKTGTSYNPQSNGVIERVHQVLGDMLRTFELEERDLDTKDPFGSFLSAAAYAIRSTYHTVLEASPAELVFGRHMLLPVKFNADWQAIQAKRQKRMEDSNARENASRIELEYKIGDLIMKARPGKLAKLRGKRDGPYTVTHVYTNGTLRIQKGVVAERISIRRVAPYYEPDRD